MEAAAQTAAPKNRVQRRHYYENLAKESQQAGDYPQAIAAYQNLCDIVSGANKERVLLNLTHLWLLTGEYQRVIDSLAVGNRAENPTAMVNISSAYMRLGREGEALALLDRVIEAQPSDTLAAIAWQNKGYALWALKSYQEAGKAIETSLAYNTFSDADQAIIDGNLALVLAHQGLAPQALSLIDRAIAWQEEKLGESHPDYLISLRKKAEILHLMSNDKEAAAVFRTYFNGQVKRLRADWAHLSPQGRQNLWASQCRWLAQGYAYGQANPELALEIAMFSKSIARGESELPTAKALLAALRSGEVLADIVRYEDQDTCKYAALICRKGSEPKWLPLFAEEEVTDSYVQGQRSYGTVAKALTSRSNAAKNRLYADAALTQKVLEPLLAEAQGASTLYIVPDGLYHLLAVEYLPKNSPNLGIKRLSASDQLVGRHAVKPKLGNLLLAGGIDYNDASLVATDSCPSRQGSDELARRRMPPAIGGGMAALKGSAAEIDTLGTLARGINTIALVGNKATKRELEAQLQHAQMAQVSTHGYCLDPTVTSIPPHAVDSVTEDKSLLMTGIIAAGANVLSRANEENLTRDDGILTAKELSGLDLSSMQMIVLSACQTALGHVNAEGASGLIRALKMAGARTVVASLWEVDDRATLALMTNFYKTLLGGLSPTQALEYAMEQMGGQAASEEEPATRPGGARRRANVSKAAADYSLPYYRNAFVIVDDI